MKFKVNNEEVFASTGGRPFDKNKPFNSICSWKWFNTYDMGATNKILCISWL